MLTVNSWPLQSPKYLSPHVSSEPLDQSSEKPLRPLHTVSFVNLVLLIESSEFAFKSCVCLRCIQCRLVDVTLDAPKINATFEGKFGTFN